MCAYFIAWWIGTLASLRHLFVHNYLFTPLQLFISTLISRYSAVEIKTSLFISKMGKRIALFGATGQTGIPLVVQALQCKDVSLVKTLVRNLAKMESAIGAHSDELSDEQKSKLVIVEVGDIFQEESLVPHLTEVDVVVSTLGFNVQRPST